MAGIACHISFVHNTDDYWNVIQYVAHQRRDERQPMRYRIRAIGTALSITLGFAAAVIVGLWTTQLYWRLAISVVFSSLTGMLIFTWLQLVEAFTCCEMSSALTTMSNQQLRLYARRSRRIHGGELTRAQLTLLVRQDMDGVNGDILIY